MAEYFVMWKWLGQPWSVEGPYTHAEAEARTKEVRPGYVGTVLPKREPV